MAVSEFGVTHTAVAAIYFPQWRGGFSATGAPTATAVGTIITEAAANLQARLYAENVIASAITDSASAAYVMCAGQVKRMAALRILRELTQGNPELAKALEAEIEAWFKGLAAQGGTWLGDESLNSGDSDPDGPTTHISQFSLTTDSADDMSSTAPLLRKDDAL